MGTVDAGGSSVNGGNRTTQADGSLLLARLTAIARRELDDRTLPGEAQDLLDLIQAASEVVVLTYDPSKTDAQNDEYQRRARRFNRALSKFGVGQEAAV